VGSGSFGAEGMNTYGSGPAWSGAADEVDSYAVPMHEVGGEEHVGQADAAGLGAEESSGGLPGRMERVDDKWVFVRRETSEVV